MRNLRSETPRGIRESAMDGQDLRLTGTRLYDMGVKEKEHEAYFRKSLENNRLLPLFERIFGWGQKSSFNDNENS